MALLSTHPILSFLPSCSISGTKLLPFSIKPLKKLEPVKPLSLTLYKPTFLPPLRATYDIPISMQDEEYEKFLETEPWKGCVVYKRDASVTHVEFSTTLDDLAIGYHSSRVSADRATVMGLKLPPRLHSFSDEDEDDEEEDYDRAVKEVEEKKNELEELFKKGGMIQGKDENGDPISLTMDELRDADIKIKYANENGQTINDDDEDELDLDNIDIDELLDDFDVDRILNFVDTPVLVSADVTRKRGRIRLDGIIRTVVTTECQRCFAPTAQCIFRNFSLLLSESPIEEPPPFGEFESMEADLKNKKKSKPSFEYMDANGEIIGDDDIEWDDKIYFPHEQKEIDISKHVRDNILLSVTIDGLCSSSCKGYCAECDTNLNESKCKCNNGEQEEEEEVKMSSGPLKDLRKKLENKL